MKMGQLGIIIEYLEQLLNYFSFFHQFVLLKVVLLDQSSI